MILEGVVTTRSRDGVVNVAPMGPQVGEVLDRFTLRPFRTAQTYRNLREHPEGVLHVTDDVLLLARAAVGRLDPLPAMAPAEVVAGFLLTGACRAYEFRAADWDERGERVRVEAEVVRVHRFRDFFGFNRAMHAVVEAAILATRVHLLPREEIEAEYRKLEPLVRKTGGPRESEAFALLRDYVGGAA